MPHKVNEQKSDDIMERFDKSKRKTYRKMPLGMFLGYKTYIEIPEDMPKEPSPYLTLEKIIYFYDDIIRG